MPPMVAASLMKMNVHTKHHMVCHLVMTLVQAGTAAGIKALNTARSLP